MRVPAAFCGIASIKPTSGRLPRTGHFPPAGGWIERLWQIGPMARRVEDLVTLMPLLAGADGRDISVVDMPVLDPPRTNIAELRVAFYTNNGLKAADSEVAEVVRAAATALAAEGARVEEARPAGLESAWELEMKLLGADGGDGVRDYLRGLGSTELHPLLTGWLDKLLVFRTDVAGFAGYWDQWQQFREGLALFADSYDVILCPVYSGTALPHATSIEPGQFAGFSFTMAWNVAGWPAAVVNCGMSEDGLPIGVQIVAPPWREDLALAVALRVEKIFGGWSAPRLDRFCQNIW